MSPRPDVSEERRNQILEAAIATFARLGFQQTRMDDIAQESGLSKGALYLYYKSKDAIIAALLKYFFTQEFKRLEAFVAVDQQETTVYEQILTLSRELTAAMQWMTRLMPIAFEFYAIAGRDRGVRQFLKEYYVTYQKELACLIQRGIDRGEFRPANAESTATTLVALYEGLALLFFVDNEPAKWTEQVEMSTRLLLQGLAPTKT